MNKQMSLLLIVIAGTTSLLAQEQRPGGSATAAIPVLIRDMTGTWSVDQRMWTGAGTDPIVLPSAIGRRRLLEGGFLEELMEKSPRAQGDTFTRIAWLNFNAVTQRFEYVSIDSRAPQLMLERSLGPQAGGDRGSGTTLLLFGDDTFVAAQWGDAKNAAFNTA